MPKGVGGAVSTVITAPRWSHAKSVADDLTEEFSDPPIPVLEIAESNRVDVVFTTFGKHNDAVAGFCDFQASKLYVNADDPTTRQNFTMAHELGHWLLHREIYLKDPERYPVLPRFQSVSKHDPMEQEANHFAANLLVPQRLLGPVKHYSAVVLADAFAVSRTMMEYRLKNVG